MAEEEEVQFTKPNVLLDLERRQEEERAKEAGEEPPPDENARVWQVEDNETDAFIGVDPEYQNYADETHKPFMAEEGAEQVSEERVVEYLNSPKEGVVTEPEEEEVTPKPRRQRSEPVREPAPE